jgi:uncharacterized protein Yka (UPF0111/DUF47 family)
MFSLQQLFGKGDRFFKLLEDSAREAQESVRLLVQILKDPLASKDQHDLVLSRRKEKKIAEQISEELVRTFITGLEREDIEALSRALYKIPKSVEKFGERYGFAAPHLEGVDFATEAELMLKAVEIVVAMVEQLRHIEQIEKVKELNDRLQYVEGEADKLMVEILRILYSGKHDALKVLVAKDLFELMEKIIDRCRDAGNIVLLVSLKNS